MKKITLLAICKALLLIALAFLSLKAQAQGRFLDISVDGSYQKTATKSYHNTRKSLGLELGIPLTSFFTISAGQNYLDDRTKYTDEWVAQRSNQSKFPDNKYEQAKLTTDTTVNGAVGIGLGALRPSVFGGALWRRECTEDSFQDDGCEKKPLTWNAGISASVFLTYSLRFKASYRISPSEDNKKIFDTLMSLGLTWGL